MSLKRPLSQGWSATTIASSHFGLWPRSQGLMKRKSDRPPESEVGFSDGGLSDGSGPKVRFLARPWLIWPVQVASPTLPRFVKIWMTPAEASVPYRVVAAAPLMTSTRSMSCGLMLFSGLDTSLLLRPE